MSVLSSPFHKKLKVMASDSAQSLPIVGLVLGVAGGVAVTALSMGRKDFALVAGLIAVLLGAVASGNPRLYCVWGFILTLPLTLSKRFGPMFVGKPGGEDSFRIELNDFFLLILAGYLVWEVITERRKGVRIPKVSFLWLALIGIGCAWVFVGPWRITAAHEVVRMLKVLFLFIVIANELNRPGRVWHCITGLTLAAMGESIIALIQYYKKGLIGLQMLGETTTNTIRVLAETSVEGDAVFRPSGLLQHANLLAVFLAVSIPLATGMFMISRRIAPRVFFLLVLALAIPAEVVAMSRSAWVSAALALGLFFVFTMLHPGLRFRAMITSSVACLIGIIVLAMFIGPVTTRLLRSKDDATNAREIYKADARRMIEASPWLGRGLNSYVFELPNFSTLAMRSYGDQPPAVHNIFYLWWAETGIVGMLIFCGVWLWIILTGLANLAVKDEFLYVVNAACVSAMIGLIPDSFLSFTLRVNTTLRLFWFLAAVILAVRYLRLQRRRGFPVKVVPQRTRPKLMGTSATVDLP
jgi:putative inorganic carbon (hco3(-)) transporter